MLFLIPITWGPELIKIAALVIRGGFWKIRVFSIINVVTLALLTTTLYTIAEFIQLSLTVYVVIVIVCSFVMIVLDAKRQEYDYQSTNMYYIIEITQTILYCIIWGITIAQII